MEVVAGILQDDQKRVLLAQRRPDGDHGDLWEFPGGKREPGESCQQALIRELREELGIAVHSELPLTRVVSRQPHARLSIQAYEVSHWSGTPQCLAHQALQWCSLSQAQTLSLPPLDQEILRALCLPDGIQITPPVVTTQALQQALLRSAKTSCSILLRLRWKPQQVDTFIRWVRDQSPEMISRLMVHGVPELAIKWRLPLHLSYRQREWLVAYRQEIERIGLSCHNSTELAFAQENGADYAFLSPVCRTSSHPEVQPLGWSEFQAQVRQINIPVYALGGISPNDDAQARTFGARGGAGISAWWPPGLCTD